jgi:hypothetical protein
MSPCYVQSITRRDVMLKPYEKIAEALNKIKDVSSYIKHLSVAFFDTGNIHVGQQLEKAAGDLLLNAKDIRDADLEMGDERFRDAQQASSNVLNAVIGGMEISKHNILEAVMRLAEYCGDDKEEEDFVTQLMEDGVKMLPNVDEAEWNSKIIRFEALSADGVQRPSGGEREELIEWFAVNSTGHVYAFARQILTDTL